MYIYFCNKVPIRSSGNLGRLLLEFLVKTRLGVEHDAVDICFTCIVHDFPDVRARALYRTVYTHGHIFCPSIRVRAVRFRGVKQNGRVPYGYGTAIYGRTGYTGT